MGLLAKVGDGAGSEKEQAGATHRLRWVKALQGVHGRQCHWTLRGGGTP